MSPEIVCILSVVIMMLLLGLGMPIGFCMAIAGFLGYWMMEGLPRAMSILSFSPWQTLANYGFTVIPMFVFMGMLAGEAGFGADIYHVIRRWVGRVPGSIAITTCLGCAGFGTLSGDAVSTAVTVGRIAIPEMEKSNYELKLAMASVASAGPIAAMIPPSLLMCIYAIATEQSIGKLLIAGFLPGILTAVVFSLMIYLRVRRNPDLAPITGTFTWSEKLASLKRIWIVFVCATCVVGGIYSGIFTPTEAGGMGALFVLAAGILTGRLDLKGIWSAVLATIRVSGMLSAILLGAFIFGYTVAISNIVPKMTNLITSFQLPVFGMLLCIMAIYLVLGAFMQAIAMIFITMPFVAPMLQASHVDPIWAGVLIVHMCEVGCITPPFGITLFATKSVKPDVPTSALVGGIMPFLVADAIVLAILMAFPQISLFLPSLMR